MQGSDAVNMSDRCDEEVTMGLGVSVQENEDLPITVEEQIFLIV